MGDAIKDSRFSHIANDPRFKTIPRSQRQIKIDKRFEAMFKEKRFQVKYSVDKRGRPISRSSKEDLERYYALSSDSDSECDDSEPGPSKEETCEKDKASKPKVRAKLPNADDAEESTGEEADSAVQSSEVDSEPEIHGGHDSKAEIDETVRSDDEQLTDKIKSKLRDLTVDYARGEGAIMSDSSSEEDSSEDDEDVSVEHGWGELDKDAERTDEVTNRLALCNMDWDRIRAVDLMVLLSSFTPPGGLVRSVTIYPSEFGLNRMKKEEEEGPPELTEQSSKGTNNIRNDANSSDENESVSENEEGSNYHMEKLRQYQLNRLKYFYAIVECDSVSTANHIYNECDGMEYESSATRLDLRFVPDDTTFEQEPREKCSEMPDATKYRPRNFTTTALQQAKVELTWDETDPNRTDITKRLMAGESVDDDDLQAYLAASSEEESSEGEEKEKLKKGKKENKCYKKQEDPKVGDADSRVSDSSGNESEGDEDPIAKYRSLLNGLEEEEKQKENRDVHMEISWGLGLKERTEEAVKKRLSSTKDLTPFQEMMEKRRQKQREKKKLKLQQKQKVEGENDSENSYSDDDIPSDIDMNDPYFAEERKGLKISSKKKKGKKDVDAAKTEEEQQKKAELELLLLEKDDDPKHFNFKKIQDEESGNLSKRKKKAMQRKEKSKSQNDAPGDDFKVNVDDSRFSALFSSHHYNIDPTDSHFRKSHGMEALISAKQKRLADSSPQSSTSDASSNLAPSKKRKKDAELSLLVKSVKNKAQKLMSR